MKTIQRSVVIRNPNGFHVRPATALAEAARRYTSRVVVWYQGRCGDARRVLDLIMLGAEPGAEVTLEVDGPDAEEALEALAEILSAEEPPPLPVKPPPKKG